MIKINSYVFLAIAVIGIAVIAFSYPYITYLPELGYESVVVWLKDNEYTSPSYQENMTKKREEIRTIQDRVLSTLPEYDFILEGRYEVTNGFYGRASRLGIEKLRNNADVKDVFIDEEVHGF